MKEPRALPNAFLVNDSIYVLGRKSNEKKNQNKYVSGEKYLLKENKWKEFQGKNSLLSAPLSVTHVNILSGVRAIS